MSSKLDRFTLEVGQVLPHISERALAYFTDDFVWSQKELDRLLTQIRLQKVITPVYRNVSLISEQRQTKNADSLLYALREEYEKRKAFATALVPSIHRRLVEVLESAGIPFLFIKGSSLRSYPYGYIRQMNDLDLMVRSLDDCLQTMQALIRDGYNRQVPWESPWLQRMNVGDSSRLHIVGHFNLYRVEDDFPVVIDLHTAPFISGVSGILESQMWERAQTNPAGVHMPTPEDQLLILVAHAVNHGYFLIKDFNDIYAILSQHQESIDWDYFCHSCRENTLTSAAFYSLDLVQREYESRPIPQSILEHLKKQKSGLYTKTLGAINRKGPEHRELAEKSIAVLHTLAYEKDQHRLAAGLGIVGKYLWITLKRKLLQNERFAQFPLTRPAWNFLHTKRSQLFPAPQRGEQIFLLTAEDVCESELLEEKQGAVNLPPVHVQQALEQSELAPRLKVRSVGESALFVRMDMVECMYTPAGIYIPTRDGVFTEAEVTALHQLIEQLLKVSTSTSEPGLPLAHAYTSSRKGGQ